MPILQGYTSSGKVIDKARWEIDSFQGMYPNDTIQIVLRSDKADLFKWAVAKKDKNIWVEKTAGKEFTITVGMRIERFIHLFDGKPKVESMAVLMPSDKMIEHILVLVLDSDNADPRFEKLIKGNNTMNSL